MKNNILPLFGLLSVLLLVGAGCPLQKDPTALQTPTLPEVFKTPDLANVTEPAEKSVVADSPCPDGTVRYFGSTISFCHEATAMNGKPVIVSQEGETIVLYAEGNPDFTHTIVPVYTNGADDIQAYIEDRFMTQENREACDVIKGEEGRFLQYLAAGGDLENQLKCGSIQDGSFYFDPTAPEFMFYIRIGQDTFLPSSTWIETLTAVNETEPPKTENNLLWLNADVYTPIFQSSKGGFAFTYPISWGPLSIAVEPGMQEGKDWDPKYPDCEVEFVTNFQGIDVGGIAVVAGNTDATCQTLGRGGFWGDATRNLRTDEDVENYCKQFDTCGSFTNAHGIKIWKGHWDVGPYAFTDNLRNVDEYIIRHPGHTFDTIIISNERFVEAGLDALNDQIIDLVDSFTFVD